MKNNTHYLDRERRVLTAVLGLLCLWGWVMFHLASERAVRLGVEVDRLTDRVLLLEAQESFVTAPLIDALVAERDALLVQQATLHDRLMRAVEPADGRDWWKVDWSEVVGVASSLGMFVSIEEAPE